MRARGGRLRLAAALLAGSAVAGACSAPPRANHTVARVVRLEPARARPSAPAIHTSGVTPASPAPAATAATGVTSATDARAAAPAPRVVRDPIPYGPARLAAMAAYSLRHYGEASAQLTPRVIVLHSTDTPSYASARAYFTADRPHRGERPGVCAHYAVDRDGAVYELVPPTVRCRHAIGLNDSAIGVEFVQDRARGRARPEDAILARVAQRDAGVALVAWLQARFGIAADDVIGHAMANAHPRFHDRAGWRNDHGDWPAPQVRAFRALLPRR